VKDEYNTVVDQVLPGLLRVCGVEVKKSLAEDMFNPLNEGLSCPAGGVLRYAG
jgi:hypothetical protein